jgi:hypothetical protein
MSIRNLITDNPKADQDLQVNSITATSGITVDTITTDNVVADNITTNTLGMNLITLSQDYSLSTGVISSTPCAIITFTNLNVGLPAGILPNQDLILGVSYPPIEASGSYISAQILCLNTAQARALYVNVNSISNGTCTVSVRNLSQSTTFTLDSLTFFWLCITDST